MIQGRLSDQIGQRSVTAGASVVMLVLLGVLVVLRPGMNRRLEIDPSAPGGMPVAT